MDSIRKKGSDRDRKKNMYKRKRSFSGLRNFKPCYESYRMNKEMGYYHPNFKENVIIESKFITSERLKTCVEQNDIKGVNRIIDSGFIPLNRCDCCSDNDIQIAIFNDFFDIFIILLRVTTHEILIKSIINTVTMENNRRYMEAFLKKVVKFDKKLLKYSNFNCLTLEDLLDYKEDLLFIQSNGSDISYLLKCGNGDPEFIRNLIYMGANIDTKIHNNTDKNNISFREIIMRGPPILPLEMLHRSCYGLNIDLESYREYYSILNLDFWKYMTRFRKFEEKFKLCDEYNFADTITNISKLDKDTLSHIYSYF